MISALQKKISVNLNEDTLTSSVFDLMFLFPNEIFWSLLLSSSSTHDKVLISEEIVSIDYWPHWNSERTTNENYVEPDIFVRCKTIDLIIEAKKNDEFQQNIGQLKNEITAYYNEYRHDNKNVYLLTIGGINNPDSEDVNENTHLVEIIKCKWSSLLQSINMFYKSKKNTCKTSSDSSIKRILELLIVAFDLHGYHVTEWIIDSLIDQYDVDLNNIKGVL